MDIPEINIKQLLTEVLQYPNSLKFLLGLLAVNLWDSAAVSANGFDIIMWMKVTTKSKCSRILMNFLTRLIFLSVLPYRLKSSIHNVLWKCLSREFCCSSFFNFRSRWNLWSTSRLIFLFPTFQSTACLCCSPHARWYSTFALICISLCVRWLFEEPKPTALVGLSYFWKQKSEWCSRWLNSIGLSRSVNESYIRSRTIWSTVRKCWASVPFWDGSLKNLSCNDFTLKSYSHEIKGRNLIYLGQSLELQL